MELVDQKRTGLLSEHDGIAPIIETVRATVPVTEALRAAGAKVEPLAPEEGYRITLGDTMPSGIVATNSETGTCLRMANEPEWPGAYDDYWTQVDWTPCPVCGAPIVWYEAAYVPGYRVCTRPPYHHSLAK